MRLRDISRILARMGIQVTPPRGGGSHYQVRTPGGSRPIVLPAHNGEKTDISEFYVRQLCRQLGIDVDDFKKR